MGDLVQTTKTCKLCGNSFTFASSKQTNCVNCATKSGDAHKAANQLKKAFKLAAVFGKHGVSAPVVAELDEHMWGLAAELAQVTQPSEITQALTITLLRGGADE